MATKTAKTYRGTCGRCGAKDVAVAFVGRYCTVCADCEPLGVVPSMSTIWMIKALARVLRVEVQGDPQMATIGELDVLIEELRARAEADPAIGTCAEPGCDRYVRIADGPMCRSHGGRFPSQAPPKVRTVTVQ
jgi:hypothetical protein